MDSETLNQDLPHKCNQCDRSFKTSNALLAHSQVHKRAVPIPDPIPRSDAVPEKVIIPIVFSGANQTGAAPAITNATTMTMTTPIIPTVKLCKLPHYGSLPEIAKATPGSAGYDLYAAISKSICIGAGERDIIPTGLSIELPVNFVAKVVPRSGLAVNHGITLLNTPGIIDADYRGEMKVILVNHSRTKFWVQPGMRIAQMMIEKLPMVSMQFVEQLSETGRGTGGFGSTGTK